MAGKRLARADWVRAAVTALAERGVAAVAVEPLAARLGTTKGSFYWHFADREALLAAALENWEHEHTDDVVAALADITDPAQRLRSLLHGIFALGGDDLAVVLAGDTGHPLVRAALARVAERRVAYVERALADLGLADAEAHRRAVVLYGAYIGYQQIHRTAPELAPAGQAAAAFADSLLALLPPTAGTPG
ncbi:TetR/AcrR family transcriptional regulator [Kineococcus glutinatus]|uniref:TetR/AcrR family transcriptional regulator n=1 Tax=Kineococcus glutinatus TaxID=1070872 RepID=A0ABP9H7A6_9ACTN